MASADMQAVLYYTFAALQGYRPAEMAMGYRHWAGVGVKEVSYLFVYHCVQQLTVRSAFWLWTGTKLLLSEVSSRRPDHASPLMH